MEIDNKFFFTFENHFYFFSLFFFQFIELSIFCSPIVPNYLRFCFNLKIKKIDFTCSSFIHKILNRNWFFSPYKNVLKMYDYFVILGINYAVL